MVTKTSEAEEILIGALLSDATITSGSFRIELSGAEHIDWLIIIKEALELLNVRMHDNYPLVGESVSHGKPYVFCRLATIGGSYLIDKLYDTFWINGSKGVPPGFCFTPVSLSHMFMGDGSSRRDKTCVDTRLSTEAFDEASVSTLISSLARVGILHTALSKNHRVRTGAGLSIRVLQDDTDKFMRLVEPYIVSSYMYKVKYRPVPVTSSKFVKEVRRTTQL